MENNDSVRNVEQIQSRNQTKAIITFLAIIIIGVAASAFYFLYLDNSHSNLQLLYLLLFIVLIVAIYISKIYKMFERKVFSGVIVNADIRVVSTRTYPGANTVGTTYSTKCSSEIELTVKAANGKLLQKVYPYTGSNTELQVGDHISVYRFIKNPIKIKAD